MMKNEEGRVEDFFMGVKHTQMPDESKAEVRLNLLAAMTASGVRIQQTKKIEAKLEKPLFSEQKV